MRQLAENTGKRRIGLRGWLARALGDQRGGIAIQFAVLALPLSVLAFGLIDVNKASVAKRTLQDALDAATLMAARSSATTDSQLQAVGSAALLGQLSTMPDVTLQGSTFKLVGPKITATATMKIKPVIADLWLKGDMTVGVESDVVRGMNKLEVALVLDNTGSMAGTKLTNLKTAAKNLVDNLAAASARSTEPNAIKIGIVPFSQTVRIDSAYKTSSWMDKTAISPIHNEIFSTATNRFTLYNNMGVSWAGCVESRPAPYDVQDTAPSTTTPATLFVPYFAPDEPDPEAKNKNGDFGDFSNDYLPDEVYSKSNWKIPQGNVGKYDESPDSGEGPNEGCDMKPLMRLTTNWSSLKTLIDSMNATGNTNIGMGAVWGWHVLSPNAPFSDGAAYNTAHLTKIAIIMTDGESTFGDKSNSNDSPYNGLGYIWQGRLGITSGSESTRTTKMDERLSTLCNNMKNKNIRIYTIRVEVSTGSSTLLKNCASDADKFYDVQNASQLNAVFQAIAGDIASMRIAR